jgi:hypothetical protein
MGERDVTATCAPVARSRGSIYGVRVTSEIPLAFGVEGVGNSDLGPLAEVALVEGNERDFTQFAGARAADDVFVFDEAADGTAYLRWPRLYEFAVAPDGSRIACRALDGCDVTVLQHFLFGQVLAVGLVRQGIEPLHAAVVTIDDAAVAFLGDCTYGKSTLLASFVDAGHRALTDDMLVVVRHNGELLAMPGSGRIKLFPESAGTLFENGPGVPLTPSTSKKSFPLNGTQRQPACLPLRLLYVLPTPAERDRAGTIDIRPVSRAAIVRDLVANTFTIHVVSRARLARQFEHATAIASSVDAFQLRYPTGLQHLPALRRAIVDHAQQRLAQHKSMTESV